MWLSLVSQITEMIQTKLVLARGVRSHEDQDLMHFGTLKIMLAQLIHAEEGLDEVYALTLAELHVFVLRSFINFNKAPTKFNEALAKPYHRLKEVLLEIDFRYHSK